MRIAYLFTTFPAPSETFYQREVRALQAAGVKLELFSLWKGHDDFNGHPVLRFKLWDLIALLWALPYWAFKRPAALWQTLEDYAAASVPSRLNLGENLLGLGFAVVWARQLARSKPDLLHAAWATGPAAAALLISRLIEVPYSTGAHAYDIFRNGGDWILPTKLKHAAGVHCSTEQAAQRVKQVLGGRPHRCLHVVRRSLSQLPEGQGKRWVQETLPVRLLSVGRMVEKKGFFEQLGVYHSLKARGVAFNATIIGGGPLYEHLKRAVLEQGLSEQVELPGPKGEAATQEAFSRADFFLFTGKVAADGDRDGLPNVIAEAMSHGCIVLSTAVAGTTEAIHDGRTGRILPLEDPEAWADGIVQLLENPQQAQSLIETARVWVEQAFDPGENGKRLLRFFEDARKG